MDEVIYSNKVLEEHKEPILQSFLSFEAKYKQENIIQEKATIDVNRNVRPNWSCIFNQVKRMGEEATPIAQKGQLTLVVFKDEYLSIYRNEDLSQSPKPLDNGTEETISHSSE